MSERVLLTANYQQFLTSISVTPYWNAKKQKLGTRLASLLGRGAKKGQEIKKMQFRS
jgi:hypothetical protein